MHLKASLHPLVGVQRFELPCASCRFDRHVLSLKGWQAKYPGPIEARAWKRGNAADLLPLVHFALLGYSKLVHDMILAQGYDLFAKTDMRFLEAVYKVLREEFGYLPQVLHQPPAGPMLTPR